VNEPQAWATVTLTNGDERVLVMLTDVDEAAFYGSPIAHADNRVVFPRSEWEVVADGD
jgi:hypothetical protein